MNPYIEIIRPGTSLLAALGAIIGAVISGAPFSILFLYIFLAVFLITGAGMVLNDYYDLEIDKVNAPHRPLPSERISKREAFSFSGLLFLGGFFFSALLGPYFSLLTLVNSWLEVLYASDFKRRFLIGNIVVSYLAASVFLFGALLTFDFRIVWIISLLAFLANMGREIFKAIEDIKGDREMKLETLPIVAGIRSAREIAQGFIASAVLLSSLPYLSGLLRASYLRIVSLSNILFLYSFSQTPTKIKKITKVAMLIVLLAVLLAIY